MRHSLFRCLTIAFGLLAAVTTSQAQLTQIFTTNDGLPSSHIDHLTFDEQDFLWVSTDLGLARFNGHRFISYNANPGNPFCLQERQVNSLYTDHEKRQWVCASDGLYSFDRTTNSFKHYFVNPERSDISVAEVADHPLKPNCLIVCTKGWGLQEFDIETETFNSEQAYMYQQMMTTSPGHILVDRHARLWCSLDKGITVIDLKSKTHRNLTDDYPWLGESGFKVQCMVEDKAHNRIFIGTERAGLIEVDMTTLRFSVPSIAAKRITALKLTPDNRLLIGSECQGLWRYDCETGQSVLMQQPGPVNLDVAKVHSITYDSQMNLWLGIYQKGVYMIPNLNGFFTHKTINSDPQDERNLASVTGFAALPNGGRAYATDGAGVIAHYGDGVISHYSTRTSSLETDNVLAINALDNGTILVGTYQYGVYVIGTDRKLKRMPALSSIEHTSVKDFEVDTLGHTVFIATSGDGLFAYDYKAQTIESVSSPEDAMKWVNDLYLCSHRQLWISKADHVRCLDLNKGEFFNPYQPSSRVSVRGFAETSDGELWMVSNNGLLHYNALDSTLVHVRDTADNQVRSYAAIMNSEDGRLWLASSGRVTQYDTIRHRFIHYIDPILSSVGTINDHASKRWPDRSFSFGGDNGIINYRPQDVDTYRRPTRPLLFTNLWIDNAPTDYDPRLGEDNALDKSLWCATELRLPAARASFSLAYTIQDYNGEIGISYSYRMRGFEDEWRANNDGEKMAIYQQLPAGEYVLEVRATQDNDEEGLGTVIRELRVIIQPEWYNTWWFRLLWVSVLALLICFLADQINDHQRVRQDLHQAELQRQVKEGKLNMLTSVSHEIKTPLTLIISPLRKMMSRKTDPATQSVLEMMYRNALRILMLVNQQMDVQKLDKNELVLHVRELHLRGFLDDLMQYFSHMAMTRHIDYKLIMPQGEDDMSIWADPSQLDKALLNLMSNAMKFVPEEGRVNIEVSRPSDDKVRISIYNSGSHLPADKQEAAFQGIGLSLAREITRLHHGDISVRDLEDGVAFDVDLLRGNDHYTPEQIIQDTNESDAASETDESPSKDSEDSRQHIALSSATLEERDKDRELVEQLSDELREKQRLRERRSAFGLEATSNVQMSSADEKLLRRVMDLIRKNIGDSEFSVETLSEQIGISRVHLNRKMKELLDISPSALIKSVRLKQAALLLVQGNVTVAEVAYSVGFSSPAYFTTNFTQYYGMTPKEFTNAYMENPDSPELKQLLEG